MELKLGHFWKWIKYIFESSEVWCWRSIEEISWTDHVESKAESRRQRYSPHTVTRKKADWSGCILRRNCIKGKIDGTG